MSPRATAMSPEDRRRAIVDVVVPLLLERGSGLTTREIAEAAGIAEGTIFGVFPDKAALWRAVAEQTLDPGAELAELHRSLEGLTDLPGTVLAVTEHLLSRSQRVMAVMMVMRSMWASRPPGERDERREPGPPAFVLEADRALTGGLVELFEAHRAELAVDPSTAATVLRALVLGTRHPGAAAEPSLTPDLVAAVLLHGITRKD